MKAVSCISLVFNLLWQVLRFVFSGLRDFYLVFLISCLSHTECSTTQVNKANEVVGANITLKFSFNHGVTNESHFAIYKDKDRDRHGKIAEYISGRLYGSKYVTYPKNGSVFCNLTNLTLNHSGLYTASLFLESSRITESKVQLIVHQENISTGKSDAIAVELNQQTTVAEIDRDSLFVL